MSIDQDDCDERGRAELMPAKVYREPIRRTRRGGPRRTRHAMPDLTRKGQDFEAAVAEGAPVRRGPQAELCRRTMCCVCWALYLRRVWSAYMGTAAMPPIDWSRLPEGDEYTSAAHHEPEGINGDDDDTLPLCVSHHTGPAFRARHPGNADPFWSTYEIGWTAVRDEMRRRVAQTSKRTADLREKEQTR